MNVNHYRLEESIQSKIGGAFDGDAFLKFVPPTKRMNNANSIRRTAYRSCVTLAQVSRAIVDEDSHPFWQLF